MKTAVCQGHPARAIWGLLEELDLSAFYGSIKAVLDRPGRPATDARVLLALWLLATVEGIASAGASSFRRQERLKERLKLERAQVERPAQERGHPGPEVSQREQRARERVERVERAKATAPRTSTTDPEARVMKMPDGGFRPAYNVELATDKAKGVILGVAVAGESTDAGQALPMEESFR